MSPMTIANPNTLLSYPKAVKAKLVDESFQKIIAKKAETYGGAIGWSADAEFSRASVEVIRGIGPKIAAALGPMSVFNFANTRGGMGFAGLEPVIGKEGVTNLRNLQAALKACLLVQPAPVPEPVPAGAARFAELFASDFNGYDVSKMVGPTLVELLKSGIGGKHAEVVEQYASLIAFELLGASLNAFEHMEEYVGMSVEDIGYMVQNAYHGALAKLSDSDKQCVGERAEALMNEYASYLPEALRSALGLESEPASKKSKKAKEFMKAYGTDFNGRNPSAITIEDLMGDLGAATDPTERKKLLGDLVSFIGFGMLYGSLSMHESGIAAVEIAARVRETVNGLEETCKSADEKAFVTEELATIANIYLIELPDVLISALSEVLPC